MKIRKLIKNCITMYYVKEVMFISPWKRALTKLAVYSAFLILSFLIFSTIQMLEKQKNEFRNQAVIHSKDLKHILFWSQTLSNNREHFLENKKPRLSEGQSAFIKQGCKFINCYITYDKNLLKEYPNEIDAVVVSIKDIADVSIKQFDSIRSSNHKYIFHSLYSSENYPVCDPSFDSFFNLTWTYKLDSDIPQPFFNIYDSKYNLVGPKKSMNWTKKMVHNTRFVNKISTKTKAVAWIVNKCKTREKYQEFVKDLEKELNGYNYTLDIYGTCGNIKCPGLSSVNCNKMIEKQYFFQLILEETHAVDYISENLIKAMMQLSASIPIILGSSDYKNFLPPGSYINVQTFDMKKLGAIIDYLIRNPITYRYFFDWKNHFFYTPRPKFQVCELCEKLNSWNDSNKLSVKKDFRKWWNPHYRDACLQKRFSN